MHGSLMLYLFAGPFAFGGLANYIVPLQIGAPDMAFPRLNALSYWLYSDRVDHHAAGLLVAGGAASFGWVAYAPLSSATSSPGIGGDVWIMALVLTGFSAIFTGVNLVATIFYLRAPGMTMFRMPIFTWNMLVTGILILIAFPVLTSGSDHAVLRPALRHPHLHRHRLSPGQRALSPPRRAAHPCSGRTSSGSSAIRRSTSSPCPSSASSPRSSRSSPASRCSATRAWSSPPWPSPPSPPGVWAHHMFTTGAVLLPFFSFLSLLIAVPTGIKFFNWIGTMWHGQLCSPPPCCSASASCSPS
jgi:cytochrome c oxidase subunit 1